jgi:hypothetical protein
VEPLLLVHAAATLFLCGLIWTMQIVHYPLFAVVGREGFAHYESQHQTRVTRVVGPVMLLELGTGVLLVYSPPAPESGIALIAGLILIGFIWVSTALQAVPRHRELSAGFHPDAHRGLLKANWNRTVAWTLRSVLVLWVLASTGGAR